MTCLLLHTSGYSSVFLGSAAGSSEAELSCFKVYDKGFPLQPRHWVNITRECCILSRLHDERVDGVVQLLSVADTSKHFSLQFRPCLGGNLYQCLERRECCNEQDLAAKVVIPLLHVLETLHTRGILHRDVKPENIFFEADGKLVLGDFGLAIDSTKDKPVSRVGTEIYMAPEVLAQLSADTVALRNIPASALAPYTTAVDIWALGTLIHEALTGQLPFFHVEPSVMALKAQHGKRNPLPAGTSPECEAFVEAALQKQPAKRPSAAQLLQHPFVLKHKAAAAAVVAARVKNKVLAELGLHRPRSAKVPAPAGTAVTAATSYTAATTGSAGATLPNAQQQGAIGSSSTSTAHGGSANSSSTHSSSATSKSGPLPCVAPGSAGDGRRPMSVLQRTQTQPLSQQHVPRKVTFDFAGATRAECGDDVPGKGAAASVAGGAQQPLRAQLCASVPGPNTRAADGSCDTGSSSSTTAAGGTSACVSGAKAQHSHRMAGQQLHLLPALSEPMLLEAPCGACPSTHSEHCLAPAHSSQPCAGSTAAAGQHTATPGVHSVHRQHATGTVLASGGGGGGGCATSNSAPAHTRTLSAEHQPRSLGTLVMSSSSNTRRVVQLSSSSSNVATEVPPAATQKPPLVKSASMQASGVAAAPGIASSPKLLMFSPPKPALLMQRIRSFASSGRDRQSGSSTVTSSSSMKRGHRRHSFDVTAAGAMADGAAGRAGATPAALLPGGSSDAAAVSPLSPPADKTRPPTASASLASPLAALSKLTNLLSPGNACAAAAAAAEAAGAGAGAVTSKCCSPCGGRQVEHVVGRATQPGATGALPAAAAGSGGAGNTGTAALLVGLAGGHDVAGALISPTRSCRKGGVSFKVLSQVLRPQQHA